MERDRASSVERSTIAVAGGVLSPAQDSESAPQATRERETEFVQQPDGQLLRPPDDAVALERSRRLSAEQQVEAEKQACLELTRLLELERRKAKQQQRRISQASGTAESSNNILKRTDSPSSGVTAESQRRFSRDGGRVQACKREAEEKEELARETTDISSPFEVTAPRGEDIGGQLSVEFLFDSFSSTVFEELPGDLQKMLQVESSQDNDYDEGQPPSILSLAYRAIRTDSPRQLKEHLNVIGEEVLQSVEGAGLLGEACECGSDGCVRVLLDSGCCPDDSCRGDGVSAIHLATQNDHASCIPLLLKWGANANLQDSDGQTALFIALCEGYRECVDILIEAGTSLQIVTMMGYTVLHAAVSGDMSNALRRLLVSLRTSCDSNTAANIINYRDSDGNTALHLAASRGYQQCVEVLCGCPQTILTVKDRWNRTALDISTTDCRDILTSKDSKEVVVCVQARLPDTWQATPIAIGRTNVLRHYKCLDVELLAAQTLEQYCYNLKGHIPMLEPDMEESNHGTNNVSKAASPHHSGGEYYSELPRQRNGYGNDDHVEWAESHPVSWADHLQQELTRKNTTRGTSDPRGPQFSRETDDILSDLRFLTTSHQHLMKMDLGALSIASYRVGPLSWSPGELDKQQRGRNLHAMVGDRRGGGLGWITGGKPTEIHITLKGKSDGCLDQLAFELMIPKSTLRHYISMVIRDKAVVLHGPQGCGKTYLAKNIAEFLKHKLGATTTCVLYVALHPSFRRDDLFCLLRDNGLLKLTNEKDDETPFQPNPHIVILDDLDRISGYSTPSILAELLTMLNYRGPLNPTWVDAVYNREGALVYPAGMYYLKNASYFIATRTQASGEALPAAVMDQFSHIPLAREGEPCSGILHRQLVGRLIHTRHGDTPHRWDKVYRCVCWVWELWQLYNNYMKQLDLAELSLGLKHVLQCPVESGSSDTIQSWLCQLWDHHMAPRIKETVLHSRRMAGQHHQQTALLLLQAVVDRAFRPTCPLEMEAATALLEGLYPPTSSFGSSLSPSPHLRQRHPSRGSDSFQMMPTATPTFMTPVHSTCSTPGMRHGHMATPDTVSLGSESSNSPLSRLKRKFSIGEADTASLDRVKLRHSSSAKRRLRRLRSKTVSLFSRDRGGGDETEEHSLEGGEGGAGGVGGNKKTGKTRETGSTLPRIFKKSRNRTPLPAVNEKKSPGSHGNAAKGTRELEDIFDMLTIATSNRFDDQRSPAPKALMQSKRSSQFNSTPTSPVPDQGPPLDLVTPQSFCGSDREDFLDYLPPPLAMSMPDLLCEETESRPRSQSVTRLQSTNRSLSHSHSKEPAETHGYIPPVHRLRERQGRTGAALDEPTSEPLRRRFLHREPCITGEETSSLCAGVSPSLTHHASPLTTTTYTYTPGRRRSFEERGGGREEVSEDTTGSQTEMRSRFSPIEERVSKEEMESEGEGGEVLVLDRDSPDGKYPSDVQVADMDLPQRTFPDGAAARRHQSVRQTPSDPGQGPAEAVGRHPGTTNTDGHGISGPPTSQAGSRQLRPRRFLSEGDHCQCPEGYAETEEERSSNILFGAGLSFISPHSPIVKGVPVPVRGGSFSGGSPKLSVRTKHTINEHHDI